MEGIRVSIDNQKFQSKPAKESAVLSNRIARAPKLLKPDEIRDFAFQVGCDGCTFSPATFKNGKRNKDNFEQQQLFALDFDNKGPKKKLTFEEVKSRADSYELPVLFAYDTFSSTGHDKFRVVFLNDASITDRKAAEAVQLALGRMFPEADESCYRDVSRMYYGGKEVLYYDDKIPVTNIESVFRNFTYCMKNKYKPNHYGRKLSEFSEETGISLNKKGFLDVTVSDCLPAADNPTETHGASIENKNGKNSPHAIIYASNIFNIKENGEIFPNRYYCINFNDDNECTKTSSVSKTSAKKVYKNHNSHRKDVLLKMDKCKLYHEFISGIRSLTHKEQFGLATNLIQIETGLKHFIQIRTDNPDFYDVESNNKWEYDLGYIKSNEYYPQQCKGYCPYHNECSHGKNILSTVCCKRGSMERIEGYTEKFCSLEEMQKDIYGAICKAYDANDAKFQVIKAIAGGGKSHSYMKLMEEHPTTRFLIAAPTNLLKDEIFTKAVKLGLEVVVTPSLEEIKDEMPENVWKHIQKLYKRGQHEQVHSYIYEVIKKKKIPCLEKYVKKREKIKKWKRSIITTHRYLLSMDKKRLEEFDAIIVDEDIIFKSVISNQGEITVPKLEKLLEKTTDIQLSKKIKQLLKLAETQSCIRLGSFEWDDGDDKRPVPFDIPSFCKAEYFYMRRTEKEENLKEDTAAFLKPAKFPADKYIIVSATADENIYCHFFGEDNVKFYECKEAEYKGTLNQYPQRSMSRSSLKSDKDIIEKLMKRFGISEDKVITFMNQNIGELHFGNTEGSNALEGEDILVVGTPYHAEFLYKLAAFSMGMDFDEDEEMEPQTVEHNGYRFRFNTYENENLRAVQFWMIESELEQAVGRARLLRNKCEAHLFSNFPLSQSQMNIEFDFREI